MVTDIDYEHMKAVDLRALVDERGLKTEKRSKVAMIIALREADEREAGPAEPEVEQDPEADPDTEAVDPATLSEADQVQETIRPLHVPFDEARLRDVLEDFGDTYGKLRGVEAEKSSANSQWNAQIKKLKEEADRLHRVLQEGGERGDVKCRESFHFRENLAVVVRLDTGEVVESRPLSAEERQATLALVDEPGEADEPDPCEQCKGEGIVETIEAGLSVTTTCTACKGSGLAPQAPEAPSKPGKPE